MFRETGKVLPVFADTTVCLLIVGLMTASQVLAGADEKAPAVPGAAENPAAPKRSLSNDHSPNNVRVRFGEPLLIRNKAGEVVHKIPLMKGRAPADVEEGPNRVFFYHELTPVLVPNPNPLPGLPEVVHRVQTDGPKPALEFKLQLSSPELRDACAAQLRADVEKLNAPALKVVVEPEPVFELCVALTESVSEITLAYAKKYIKSAGDTLAVWMEFDDAATVRRFCDLWEKKQVELTYACLINANKVSLGYQRTAVDYELGMQVEREITSKNFPRSAVLDGKDGQYVLQGGHDRILRFVTVGIIHSVTVDDASVLTMFQSDVLVLADVFEPAKTLTPAAFQQMFNAVDEKALAAYLEPLLRTAFKNEITETGGGNTKTVEVTKIEGGSIGISVPFLGGGAKTETRKRNLDTAYDLSGWKLEQGQSDTDFKVSEITVHKLKAGYEKKKLSQAQSVVLGKGLKVEDYLKYTPIPASLDARQLAASVAATHQEAKELQRLRTALRQATSERDALASKLATVTAERDESRKQHQAASQEIARLQASVEEWKTNYAQSQAVVNQLAAEIYQLRNPPPPPPPAPREPSGNPHGGK